LFLTKSKLAVRGLLKVKGGATGALFGGEMWGGVPKGEFQKKWWKQHGRRKRSHAGHSGDNRNR